MEDSDVKNVRGRRGPRIRTFILRGSMQLRYKTTIHNTEKLPRPRVSHKRAHTHTLCEPAQPKFTSPFHKSIFIQKFSGKNTAAQIKPRTQRYASLRSRNAHQYFPNATFYRHLQDKHRGPKPRRKLYASLRNRFTIQYFTKAILNGHLQVKNRRPK